MFRTKFRDGLQKLYDAGELTLEGQVLGLRDQWDFDRLRQQALAKPWVVYAKRPFAGPEQVLAYLSRYTHRVGMSNRRLLELDESRGTVRFLWRDYADGARQKPMTLPVAEFIRRLCLHLLPPKFVKIRHYGFLSHRQRQAKIQQARQLLGATPRSSQPSEPPAPSLRPVTAKARVCPFCGQPTLEWVEGVEANLPHAKAFCDSS